MTHSSTHSNEPADLIDIAEAKVRAEKLAGALDVLSDGQDRLLIFADRREQAVREAQPLALAETLRDETEEIRQIAAMDALRAEQADWFAARLDLPAGQRPRATWIASRLPVSMSKEKQRIESAASTLREKIERVSRRTASDRLSADRLAQHMRGLIETTSERLGSAGGYGNRGERRVAPSVPLGIDVTS